jgi:hypothetical protein
VVRDENCNQQAGIGRTCCQFMKTIPGNKLLLDHYLDGAIEAEADAICEKNVHHRNYGTYEPCGVHTLEIVMHHCLPLI